MAAAESTSQQEDTRLRESIAHQRRLEQYCMWLNDTRLKTERAAVDWPPPTTLQRPMTTEAGQGSCDEDELGRQILLAVSSNMPVATVEGLLARVTYPDIATDSDGNTALMLAAKNANLALVDLLMRRGASVNYADPARHRTPLMCALKTGNVEIVERILTPEKSAAVCNDAVVESTICYDTIIDVNKQDIDGTSALMLAAKHGHCNLVEVLLDVVSRPRHHQDDQLHATERLRQFVDIHNKHGQTALHEAAKRGHVAIGAALIFAGATVDSADRWSNRPLQYATLHGHAAVVALLTAQRCDVNAVNLGRRAALHTAAQNGHSAIARLLVEAGASTAIRDSDGDTPTLLAGRYQHHDVFEMLVAASSLSNIFDNADSLGKNAFHYATANGYIALVIGILQQFDLYQQDSSRSNMADYSTAPDRADKKGNTALMLAVRRNHVEVVRALLQYNCNARRLWQGPGGQCHSLLAIAVRHGFFDLLPMLVDAGADLNSCRHLTDVSADVLSNDDVNEWLLDVTSQPRSLQQLSRQRVRQFLTCNIHQEVTGLPLPATLQRFIVETL